MQSPAPTIDDRLQWLVDRAAVTDLILDFARCVDDDDKQRYASNFTEDGTLVLPFAEVHGRAEILAMPGPPPSWATQHLIANIVIDINGDVANTRAWVIATHVFDREHRSRNAHAGGWYRHKVVRTDEGWKFQRVELEIVWDEDTPMIPDKVHLA